ncbi:Retrovirus-related Pol polyprotein from transposon opus [Eumeta japonica]|uniref:Retrovirus-related Pol polyprotein from transposon opus n=1 Tax=Eumeta variegata TaxID=151549 RepID=A0A4C1T9Z8_EUMVA|nr:Retrovirus-related Pol polyprotein from transposon opus [Eumeta japonica]
MAIIQRPKTLPEAYSTCLELQNLTIRNNVLHTRIFARNSAQQIQSLQPHTAPPPRPPRTSYNSPPSNPCGEKQYRLVVDYKRLNAVTVPDTYPIPDINATLVSLGNAQFITTIDLTSGFHQIPMKSSDIPKTAFSTMNRKFEFLRLPFGLKTAIFQRMIDDVLKEFIGKICYVYIDDIIVFGNSEEETLNNVDIIFRRFEEANLKVNIEKRILFKREILAFPDFDKAFNLTTDASNYAIGAVLSQGEIGKDKPITYISRSLNKTEEGYATNEKEMLAIVWALDNLRNYLHGAKKIKIYTVHQPLTYALGNRHYNAKLKRWKARIEEYNHELIYKPGRSNFVADALSRLKTSLNHISDASTISASESDSQDTRTVSETRDDDKLLTSSTVHSAS